MKKGLNLMRVSTALVGVSIALGLTACDETRRALGYERKQPDAFRVVSRAPLHMPPDYNLRPPKPGAPRPQELTPQQKAEQLVFKGEKSQTGLGSEEIVSEEKLSPSTVGEDALMNQIGSGEEGIRSEVNQEAAKEASELSNPIVDNIAFLKKRKKDPGDVINPVQEQKRLQDEGVMKQQNPSAQKDSGE